MKRFALAGNPNCGKTTLFNSLTGSTAHVGNWPGVTVEKKDGIYKKGSEPVAIIDLPGIYSLSPYTPEEVISRNYILEEKPDCIINVVDASNLERNLYLTTQLLEIDVPMVVALNMMDIVKKNGDSINVDKLSKAIGVPVVSISAQKDDNLDLLMEIAIKESVKKREAFTILQDKSLSHLISDCKAAFTGLDIPHPLFHAIKLIEMDELEVKDHPNLAKVVVEFKKTFNDDTFGSDLEAIIADHRYQYITEKYSVCKTHKVNNVYDYLSSSDKIDKVLTNKWAGIPIFLLILFLIFHLTFSENLFFLGGLIKFNAPSFEGSFFEGLFYTENGINSIGVILFNFLDCITSGITNLVGSWLSTSPDWVSGLICDGVLGGLFAVLSFLPQILLLFLFFSILEDSGYMARVAFILDRIFRKFGLTGRAFLPMIMGFGCSVPAMINTRTLADDKERTATIRVIPFFSCGAKLPILTAIAGGICQIFGFNNADFITYSMYVMGMLTAVVAILIMRKTTMRGEVSPFIMELPTYHMPKFKALMIHLWDKVKHFIKKAFTIILASTIAIWFLSHFSWNWQFLSDEEIEKSILAGLGQLITPLFTPLGFGWQLERQFSFVFVVAAITGLIAKENVIATFGALAACIVGSKIDTSTDGADIVATVEMIRGTGITWPALIAFILFNMTTIPCFAAVATAKAELPNKKFGSTILFWLATSYFVSMMVYLVLSWWWSSFIFLAFFIILGFSIHYFNRYKDRKATLA